MIARRMFLLALAGLLGGCAAQTATVAPAAVPAAPVAVATPGPAVLGLDDPAPDPMRWTYGSGEAAGASTQAWRALADYAIAGAARRPAASVRWVWPMRPGESPPRAAPASAPRFSSMPTRPRSSMSATNTGKRLAIPAEAKPSRWAEAGAAQTRPVPGVVTGVRRLREAGTAVIFNSNRPASAAPGTIRALEAAGPGKAVHRKTLFLLGDDALAGNRDGRRKIISERFCVVALGGDNLGDFTHTLNDPAQTAQQRRERATRGEIAQLWGNGWFMIPNAAYGFWQKGTIGEVFPPYVRWEPRAPAIMATDK